VLSKQLLLQIQPEGCRISPGTERKTHVKKHPKSSTFSWPERHSLASDPEGSLPHPRANAEAEPQRVGLKRHFQGNVSGGCSP
jgi:hypothetical protein